MSSIEYINSVVLTASAANVTFNNIPQYYQDLMINIQGTNSATANLLIRVGNSSVDTGSNYSYTFLQGDGSSVGTSRQSNISTGIFSSYVNANDPTICQYEILSYANTNIFKTFLSPSTNNASSGGYVFNTVGLWRSTSAINIITFYPSSGSLNSGMTATLWGVR